MRSTILYHSFDGLRADTKRVACFFIPILRRENRVTFCIAFAVGLVGIDGQSAKTRRKGHWPFKFFLGAVTIYPSILVLDPFERAVLIRFYYLTF